jgi:hypothetical protein
LQISLHVLELIIEFDLKSLARDLIESNVNSHGEVLRIIVFDCQESVIGNMVIVLDGQEDKDTGGLEC